MDDKEMLGLAAKAANIKIDKSPYNGGGSGNTGFDILGNAVLDWHNNKMWNPLTDDGDAFRLAVRLDIDITFDCAGSIMAGQYAPSKGSWDACENDSTDKLAATRRAIVRAAAEVGRALKEGEYGS